VKWRFGRTSADLFSLPKPPALRSFRGVQLDDDEHVGSVVPHRDLEIVPVPQALVQIEPDWRGYLYFVYEDEVVIVNSRDLGSLLSSTSKDSVNLGHKN
jgi:hypothetical protein